MRNVKIKKAPRTGDQKDYALVFNDKAQSTTNTVKPKVGTTMRATNNGNESIEVEGGETVVGDINYDGLLELMSFEGKRHSEGGMNVHIPDGSFIFSDTPALRIKDKEILDMFGMSGKKKHYTPAEISKKFQVNEYIDILKDDNADDISKRTANEMLKKNTEKLAMLAIVQESIKGLPNGIPDFAQNVLAGLQQQEMKMGGELPKAQQGGEESTTTSMTKPSFWTSNPDNVEEFWNKQLPSVAKPVADYTMNLLTSPIKLGSDAINWFLGSPSDYYYNWDGSSNNNTQLSSTTNIKPDITTKPVNINPTIEVAGNTPEYYYEMAKKMNKTSQSGKTNETYSTVKIVDNPNLEDFKEGGQLTQYQDGGDKKQESIDKYGYYKDLPKADNTNVYDLYFGNLRVRYENDKAIAVELKDGTKYKINTKGSFSNVNDPKDVKQFTQYDELPRLTSIATERGVKFDPTQFTNVVNIQAPQRGSIYGIEMTPDQWSDFERRHGQFIEKSTGDNFKDWKTKVEKGDKGSVAKFQKAYNDYIGYEYFKKRDSHKDPYGVDDKLGWITFSAPALYSGIEPEKPVEVNTNSTVNVTDNEKVNVDTTTPKLDDPFPKDTPRPIDTWFAPDITNFVGSLTDKINRYEPAMSKLDFVNPDYVLLDPTRQLAANQEQIARFSNQLENSVDPQIALATMLGASGQGFQNAANVLGNVENANVQITNQALNNSAQIENQEIGVNEAARQNYISQMATLNENEDRARNLKKWRVINAYNQGWHNYNKDQMMEQVLFPQVHTDNITGDVSVVPGRDITVPDTYSNLYGMGNSQNPMVSPETLKTYYDQLLNQGFTSDFAENFLLKQMGANKKKNQQSMEEGYSQAMRFGGSFNINDYTNI